jgi:phosphatidylglycerol lysyltransferase
VFLSKRISLIVSAVFACVLFGLAIFTIFLKLRSYEIGDIISGLSSLSVKQLSFAILLTIVSYVALIGYDLVSLYYVRRTLPLRRVAFASVLSYVFSNNLGFTLLTGNAIRYRYYKKFGLDGVEIAKLISLCIATFWVGLFASGGVALTLFPVSLPDFPPGFPPVRDLSAVGVVLLAITFGYLLASVLVKKPLTILKRQVSFPDWRVASLQVAVSLVDWFLASLVLYVLLPASSPVGFPLFFTVFMVAQIAGLVSHVPGGLGVFDSIMLWAFSPYMESSATFGILLIYRIVYYFLPLLLGFVAYALYEVAQNRLSIANFFAFLRRAGLRIVPVIFGVCSLVWGVASILAATSFSTDLDIRWVDFIFSFHIVEYRSLFKVFLGLLFLLLAFGVYKRSNAIHPIGIIALIAEIALSSFMGYPIHFTVFLCLLLFFFLPSKPYFNRKSNMTRRIGKRSWLLMLAMAVALIFLIASFIIEYEHIVELRGSISQALVLSFVAGTLLLCAILYFFIKPAHFVGRPSREGELDLARSIITESTSSIANLAILGDKMFVFSEDRRSFIMYGVHGRSWIAMGDPVGDPANTNELIWKFKELCDQFDGVPIFYEIDKRYLDHYIELGLAFLKIGEEARVPLEAFSTAGKENQGVRYTVNKLTKDGYSFEIVRRDRFAEIGAEIEAISKAWLEEKKVKEKRFSLGFFDRDYLANFDIAVVRKEDRIIAFCNLWDTGTKEELRVDLMRYVKDSPHGIMDFLFASLMLYGKGEGYRHFNLGIAPFSGFIYHPLGARWDKICHYIYQYVEHIYNFKGLRKYKEKFHPEWTPVYIAIASSPAMLYHIFKISLLGSSGLGGLLRK